MSPEDRCDLLHLYQAGYMPFYLARLFGIDWKQFEEVCGNSQQNNIHPDAGSDRCKNMVARAQRRRALDDPDYDFRKEVSYGRI